MSSDNDANILMEMSRHYDSMLWTVTSLWAAAVGGLLVYSAENFDPWLAVFGLILTVCAMYFAYSFRVYRRRVHEKLPEELRKIVLSGTRVRQWDVFVLVFLGLTALWTRMLVQKAENYCFLWLFLAVVATALIGRMWLLERRKTDA